MEEQNLQNLVTQTKPTTATEADETWQVLADCQISLPLARLLQLVPRFTEKVATLITQKNTEQVSLNYNQPSHEPTIMDEQSPAIKVVIQRQEVAGAIVDGGSGVNVINKTTCDRLGIRKWDACPVWLRMVDTSTVRPLGDTLRCNCRGIHFPNFGCRTSTGCNRSIFIVARTTTVKNSQYQTELE